MLSAIDVSSVTYHSVVIPFLATPCPCNSYEKACSKQTSSLSVLNKSVSSLFVLCSCKRSIIPSVRWFAFLSVLISGRKEDTHERLKKWKKKNKIGTVPTWRSICRMAVNYTYLASCYCTTSVPGFYQYRPILPIESCEIVTTKNWLHLFYSGKRTWIVNSLFWCKRKFCEVRFVFW